MPKAPDIDLMYRSGTHYRWEDGTESVIDVQPVGVLNLPTGHLIAQDPGWGVHPGVQPFTATVPPGRYSVTLSISHWDRSPTPGFASPMRRRLSNLDRPHHRRRHHMLRRRPRTAS